MDFSDEEHLAAAIGMNKQRLLGQKLSIVRSDPMQGRKRASVGGNSSRGRGTDCDPDCLIFFHTTCSRLLCEERDNQKAKSHTTVVKFHLFCETTKTIYSLYYKKLP